MNYIEVIDNSISQKNCDIIINKYSKKIQGYFEEPHNYSYCEIPYEDKILQKLACKVIDIYKKKYPEVNCTQEKWSLKNFRFQIFKPGKHYDTLHREQGTENQRLLNVIVYLSSHDCGTEFFHKNMVKSVKGRTIVFPAYWTHAHKGQPCPNKKTRYILTAYATFDE